jgi:hypothetical protein
VLSYKYSHWSFPIYDKEYKKYQNYILKNGPRTLRKINNAVWRQAIERKAIDDPENIDLSPNEYIMAERFTIELHELFKLEVLRTFIP